MVDVKSLYPYVYLSDDCYYPLGNAEWVVQRNKNKLGFYKIRLHGQNRNLPNILPKRSYKENGQKDNTQALDWDYKEP